MGKVTLRASSAKKRRLAIAAAVALAVAVIAPMIAPSAGAVIADAGDVTISMHLSVFTPTFTVAGMSTMGSASANVSPNGLITIPQSSLSFQPVEVQVNLPDSPGSSSSSASTSPAVVSVQAVATSNFEGGIDPASGAAFLSGSIELLWSQSPTMNNCPVGPFQVVTRTNAQGAIPYSSDTGTVSMVDPDFTVNAIPTATSGCGGYENAINGALSLPVTTTTTTTQFNQPAPATTIDPNSGPPVPAVVLSLTFTPAPYAAAPPPTQPRPRPTTTAATPTTESATPTSSNALPPLPVPTAGNGGGGGSVRPHYRPVSHKVGHPAQHQKARSKARRGARYTLKGKPAKTKAQAAGSGTGNTGAGGGYFAGGHKATKAARGSRQLSFVPASFVKRSTSALATGLNLAALLGLLVFSALALWLVTSELADFKAGTRRLRMHRIAGITDHR
ncbi:MAG: hypothetical protein ACLPVY_14610 [Acidimicrobiia bacterium]